MYYLGNFSYVDEDDTKDNYCLMPCIVEAKDAEEAMGKFADYFMEVRQTTDLLEGAYDIYLDSLTEFSSMPDEPMICQWQKILPTLDGLSSLTSALPLVEDDSDQINAYGWGTTTVDDEFYDPELDGDDVEEVHDEPFLHFDEP